MTPAAIPTIEAAVSRRAPAILVFMASAYVIAAIAVSNMEGWNIAVRIIAVVYGVTYLISLAGRRVRMVKPDTIHVLFVVWSVVGLIGGYNTVSVAGLFGKLLTMIGLIGISYLLYSLSLEKSSIRWLEWGVLLGFLVTIIWLFVTTGGRFSEERVAGTTGNANVLAFILLLACIVSLDLLSQYRNLVLRSALVLNSLLILPILLATGSRKGLIGFFLVVGIWLLHATAKAKQKRLLSIMLAGLVVAALVALYLPRIVESPHFARFQNLERYVKGERLVEQETSLSGRAGLARIGIGLAFRNPAFGVGIDQFRYYDQSLRLSQIEHTYSHSNVIEVLADTGLIGFTLYHATYVILALRLRRLWRGRRLDSIGRYVNLSVMIGGTIILYDIFSVTYYTKEYWLALTLVLSSTSLVSKRAEI
jgi:O-antigen ligase